MEEPDGQEVSCAKPEWFGRLVRLLTVNLDVYLGRICHMDADRNRIFLVQVGLETHDAFVAADQDKIVVFHESDIKRILQVLKENGEEDDEDQKKCWDDQKLSDEDFEEGSEIEFSDEEGSENGAEFDDDKIDLNTTGSETDSGVGETEKSYVQDEVPVSKTYKDILATKCDKTIPEPKRWSLPMAAKKEDMKTPTQFPDYVVPEEINRLLDTKMKPFATMTLVEREILEVLQEELLTPGLARSNYRLFMTFLLYAEEYHDEMEMSNYDMYSAKLVKENTSNYVTLNVPGMIDKSPNIIKGDTLCVYIEGNWIYLNVEETYGNTVFFAKNKELEKEVFSKFSCQNKRMEKLCDVQFLVNQSTYRNLHRALGLVSNFFISSLFPSDSALSGKNEADYEIDKLFNKAIASNTEQLQAVSHILRGSSWPHPYILFGPPGTGKTVTLVEAIKQVWHKIPSAKIVVAAPSNTAADLLASRLVDDIPKDEIVRIVAPSREDIEVDDKIADIIHYGSMKKGKLKKYRVVVVTLVTAGRLVTIGVGLSHFTHVFIDEAGQATEPESIMPIAGLLSNSGHVILSGDPNQLGPVTKSPVAQMYGFQTSLMERLMTKCFLYQRDENGNRNPEVITKLLKNFRSHPQLLHLPSTLFYESELVPCANLSDVSGLSKQSWLPKMGFPIIFHHVRNSHSKGENTHSIFNTAEAKLVEEYVAKMRKCVKSEDIGIVSPYRRQVRMIKERLEQLKLEDILVGSTEEFQGQEREVMIISTVRSSVEGKSLGFLTNEKRFNVAISRAKSLMIVIGDSELLSKDKHWKALVNYAKEKGGFIGDVTPEKDVRQKKPRNRQRKQPKKYYGYARR